MGNCSFKGETDAENAYNSIRIMRDSGEILELKGPKLAGDILSAFPGYSIFKKGQSSLPLFDGEQLVGGQCYYLLPSRQEKLIQAIAGDKEVESIIAKEAIGMPSSTAAMKHVTRVANGSGFEVLPSPRNGTWKVKLVINPRRLEEILAEEVNTEALIEQMRLAASSASAQAKQTKRNWGLNWRPSTTNVHKLPCENHQKVQSLNFCNSSPA